MKKAVIIPLATLISLNMSVSSFAGTTSASYSPYWIIDSGNNWHYKLANGTVITDSWIHDEVSGDTYLIDKTGNMSSGLVMSDGRYYLLDNTRGTGHFGKLLKNGEYYNGVLILADTSASYQGALSESTLNQLSAMGVNVYTAQNVTGTKHVSNGTIVSGGSGTAMIGNTVSDPTLQQTNAAMGNATASGLSNQAINKSSTSSSGLEKYHTKKPLTQSQINQLVSEYNIPVASYDGETAFPPFSSNRTALINFIDYENFLVLAGDPLDVAGHYDVAANGHVNYGGVADLARMGLQS